MQNKKWYLTIDYNVIDGPNNDDGDGSPYSGYSHEIRINHRFTLSTTEHKRPDKTFETDLNNPHVVVVLYSDGGTFGHTEGYTEVIGCFDKIKAEQIAQMIEDDASREELEKITDNKYFYKCWDGYFSSFQEVKIITKSSHRWYS